MSIKVTVLIENTTKSHLKSEHGLSLYIEYNGKKLLLDAGSSALFAENAEALGIDLSKVETAFLSHGHYDHSGGFAEFARINKKAGVYAMEQAIQDYQSVSGGTLHGIGIPLEVMEKMQGRFVFVNGVTRVAEGITLVSHSTEGLAQIGEKAGLYRKQGEELLPDDFAHEMSLVLETDKGLVICNSCSHGGLQNIVEETKRVFPGQKIYAYIGGLHMRAVRNGEEICTFGAEELDVLAAYIKECDIQLLYTGHCTGTPALALLQERLEERIRGMYTGAEFFF